MNDDIKMVMVYSIIFWFTGVLFTIGVGTVIIDKLDAIAAHIGMVE